MRNVVLIAHPEAERQEILVDGLEKLGYLCLTAASGGEALATAASYQPQLAVIHTDLPEVEGTDVCLRLKQEVGTETIAVLLIGKDSHQERFVGTEVGADAYMSEPYRDEDLFDKIRDLFRSLVLNAR